jgi:hypothetical protein
MIEPQMREDYGAVTIVTLKAVSHSDAKSFMNLGMLIPGRRIVLFPAVARILQRWNDELYLV